MSESSSSIPQGLVRNRAASMMLVLSLLSMALGPFSYFILAPRIDSFLAGILLALPSALISFGALHLLTVHQKPETLTRATAGFDAAKNLFVAAYVYLNGFASAAVLHALAIAAILAALALLLLVYRLTSWMMNGHDQQDLTPDEVDDRKGVIKQLAQHRFLSICGLLVAYINLLLLLGMSVAFHDRASGGRSFERQTRRHDLIAASERDTAPRQGPIRTFAFPNGSTSLRCTEAASGHRFEKEFYAAGATNAWRMTKLKASEILADEDCAGELSETAWNLRELHLLQAELAQIYSDAPFDRYRVAVVAHATDSKKNSGFSSNYELSRARAEQVQVLVETLLSKENERSPSRPPLNLEWQIMPSGTGNMYLSGRDSSEANQIVQAGLVRALTTELQLTRIPDHLTALQWIELARPGADPPLQLLDYLYFMTTLATPNDLAPASGFVQFVGAAAHVSQLFLLVVAFNVLLAIARPITDDKTARGA